MGRNHLQLPLQRSKSVSKDRYSNYANIRSSSQIRTHRRRDDYVVADKSNGNKRRQNENNLKKNTLDDRPPFNLDTRIDGYDDVDENGRYRRKYSEPRKKETKHADYSAAWVSSLRDSYDNKKGEF